MEKFKHLPNFITSLRIAGTLYILFTAPFSKAFYVLYTFSGITDVLDGAVARAMKVTSQLGAKLDSIADLLFYTVMMIKILPYLWEHLPVEIWYVVGAILIIRVISYAVAAKKYRRFASLHTYGNKLTGLAVFAIPYFIVVKPIALGCSICVCVIAFLASIEEMFMHMGSDSYDPDRKTLFMRSSFKKESI